VAANGWPQDEAGLRALPGIGAYTARALLAFAFDCATVPPPRDVNLGRVAARAVLGVEAGAVPTRRLDEVLAASPPPHVSPREHAFALFDLGATVCLARRPQCANCPLAGCASRARLADGGAGVAELTAAPPRQPRYAGSMRQLRGAVLRALLQTDAPPATWAELNERVAGVPAAGRAGAVEAAVDGLRRDGLLGRDWPDR
jgi:A/G-specific adenine glycosylase